MRRLRIRTDVQITLAAMLVLLACLAYRELIPTGGGLGADGLTYGRWVMTWRMEQLWTELSPYRIQRTLPFIAVHYGMRALGVELNPTNVIHTFTAINVACITAAVYLWCRTATHLDLGTRQKWIGFALLVLSYSSTKFTAYYPVLTDRPALLLGSLLLWAYVERRAIVIAVATLVSGFTWPVLAILGAILFAFPRPLHGDAPPQRAMPGWLPTGLAGLAAFAVIPARAWSMMKPPTVPVEPLEAWMPLSLALAGLFLYLGLRPLLASPTLWGCQWRRHLLAPRPWIALALAITPTLIAAWLGSGRASSLGGARYAQSIAYFATAQPGVFALAHVLTFGPLLILIPWRWSRMSQQIITLGPGFTLVIAATIIQALDSESRHLVHALPWVALVLAATVGNRPLGATAWTTLLVATAILTRVWMRYNTGPVSDPSSPTRGWRELYRAPNGPWMAHSWYVAQAIGVLIIGAAVVATVHYRRRQPETLA